MPNLLLGNIDKILAICAAAIGAFAVLMKWFYLFEAVRGIYLIDFAVYKRSINTVYTLSTIMLVLLYLSASKPDGIILSTFCWLIIAWLFTAVLALFLPLLRGEKENKASVRKLSVPSIGKVCILFVLLWLIH